MKPTAETKKGWAYRESQIVYVFACDSDFYWLPQEKAVGKRQLQQLLVVVLQPVRSLACDQAIKAGKSKKKQAIQ